MTYQQVRNRADAIVRVFKQKGFNIWLHADYCSSRFGSLYYSIGFAVLDSTNVGTILVVSIHHNSDLRTGFKQLIQKLNYMLLIQNEEEITRDMYNQAYKP
jgi:hypothetical protein